MLSAERDSQWQTHSLRMGTMREHRTERFRTPLSVVTGMNSGTSNIYVDCHLALDPIHDHITSAESPVVRVAPMIDVETSDTGMGQTSFGFSFTYVSRHLSRASSVSQDGELAIIHGCSLVRDGSSEVA